MSASNTPKNYLTTPLRITKRQYQALPETPECFKKVTVETPAPCKNRRSTKLKCDEVRNLVVAVRVRPMNVRELSHVGAKNIITVNNNKVIVNACSTTKLNHVFPYDYVFWSCDENDYNYSSQENVFVEIGLPLLDNAFLGYNACLFAYGQTGSGKSYSMMGADIENIDCNNAGIIPRFCKELFIKISQLVSPNSASIDISYFEIYNEKIHDLLMTYSNNQRTALKVREHPVWGPYVVNLSTHTVKSYEDVRAWLLLGNKNRATAATVMNEKSSRSHSIFSIELSLIEGSDEDKLSRRSKISLIDLAGSERLGNMHNEEKLKQGVSINKSLMTLGKVICALADQKKGVQFIPYRESVLTWLLRESLGGNSLTSMLATITPANSNVDETLATLRYACQARSIVNRAHVNEDPHDRLIRELKLEVQRLQSLRQEYEKTSLSSSSLQIDNSSTNLQELEELRFKLNEKEEELKRAQQHWEYRYKETQQLQLEQLAEAERQKEELESRIRIITNIDDHVNLTPFQSNFLEEVENILTPSDIESLLSQLETQLQDSGFQYHLNLNDCKTFVNIVDIKNNKRSSCSVNQIKSIQDLKLFIENLKWKHDELTESVINSTMNDIYNAAKVLQSHIDKDESMRLTFAKFIKSAQTLETVLLNKVHINKTKKVVTFRL